MIISVTKNFYFQEVGEKLSNVGLAQAITLARHYCIISGCIGEAGHVEQKCDK
jgi:hypothetical protein